MGYLLIYRRRYIVGWKNFCAKVMQKHAGVAGQKMQFFLIAVCAKVLQ